MHKERSNIVFRVFLYDRTQSYELVRKKRFTNSTTKMIGIYDADFCPIKKMLYGWSHRPTFYRQKMIKATHTYFSILNQIDPFTIRNWGTLTWTPKKFKELEDSISKGTCIAASDGSVKHKQGAHAWCFARSDKKGKIFIESAAPVDAEKNYIHSFRAEALGVLAILQALEVVVTVSTKALQPVKIYTDCKSLISKISIEVESTAKYALSNDVDVIMELRRVLEIVSKKIKLTIIHVKAHMDDKREFEDLPMHEKLNCIMDKKVAEFLSDPQTLAPREMYPIFKSQLVYLSSNEKPLASHIQNKFMKNFQEKFWTKYSEKHLDLGMKASSNIEWECLKQYLQRQKHKAFPLIKIIHNQVNTMTVNYRWGTSQTNICPLCGCFAEDTPHILQCSHKLIQEARDESISKIL